MSPRASESELSERTRVIRGDALEFANTAGEGTLVLADPPYNFVQWPELLDSLSASLVVAESDRELSSEIADCIDWQVIRTKRYGRAYVTFIQRIPYRS